MTDGKLVRDLIPDLIRESGRSVEVRRLAGENVPLPFADALEQRVIPTVDKLVEAVRRLASY